MNAQLRYGVNLAWLGDAVVICVLPETQRGKDRIMTVNTSVAIPAVRRFIVLRQRKETIWSRRSRLWGEVSKQFRAVVYRSIAIPIKGKEASSDPAEVQEILSLMPSLLRSKDTPPGASVRLKPLPKTSIRIGDGQQYCWSGGRIMSGSQAVPSHSPPPPPPPGQVLQVRS